MIKRKRTNTQMMEHTLSIYLESKLAKKKKMVETIFTALYCIALHC